MRVRQEIRAHRVAVACALAIVVVGGTAVAIILTDRGSSALAVSPPFACHVTRPNGSAPPGGGAGGGAHGKHGLWTALPPDGVLRITRTIPPPPGTTLGTIHADGSLATKFPWWGSRRANATLAISGQRLDAAARGFHLTLHGGRGGPIAKGSPHFWPSRLRFARPGCWRVSARSGRARLSFTIAVQRASA